MKFISNFTLLRRRLGPDARSGQPHHERRHEHAPVPRDDAISGAAEAESGRRTGVAIDRLNELEMVRGEIWANVWQTDYIVRISPKDGRVLGWIDLKGLLGAPNAKLGPEAVLNGIAFDHRRTGSS